MKQIARILLTVVFVFAAISATAGGVLKVTGNSVRLRDANGYDTGYRVNKGDRLQWYNYNNGWYTVQYGQYVLYVSAQYVKRVSQSQCVNRSNAVVVITGDRVILRKSPGGKKSKYRAYVGDRFYYYGQSGDWNKIYYNGKYYWVSKLYSYVTY